MQTDIKGDTKCKRRQRIQKETAANAKGGRTRRRRHQMLRETAKGQTETVNAKGDTKSKETVSIHSHTSPPHTRGEYSLISISSSSSSSSNSSKQATTAPAAPSRKQQKQHHQKQKTRAPAETATAATAAAATPAATAALSMHHLVKRGVCMRCGCLHNKGLEGVFRSLFGCYLPCSSTANATALCCL